MTKTPKLELPKTYSPEPIAVIGLGAIMPDAHSVDEFWQNIVTGKNSIEEVPKERWDPDLFWSDDRDAPDKTYSKIGAFIKNFSLNPIDYRIPPNVLTQIDPVQQMALAAAKEALEDANYTAESFPTEKTAVIIGNSLGGEKSFEVSQRVYFPAIVHAMKQTENFKKLSQDEQVSLVRELEEVYKRDIPIINEDSMPGELANIVAGRIAATFNLRGKNMTSDAACASSLAAIDIAVKGLQAREYDAAVVGGSDRSMDPPTFVKFAKIGALSADGSYPFDERANGFVQGEGAGMMILKRLTDALEANDKIYALVTGIGSSSDGKGKGITAPNPIGQELAVRRALEAANISADQIQLLEAHGTSTSVGDFVEVSTIEKVYKEEGAKPRTIKLGSIKSQIGHLKSAAGAAGLLKAILAIHHKTYPPSINFETPNSKIDWDNSPLIVNTHPVEWPKPEHTVRRAGVSSFGFGGTNFHVVLEEYDPTADYSTGHQYYSAVIDDDTSLGYDEYVARNRELELESLLISANDQEDVMEQIETITAKGFPSTFMENEDAETLIDIVTQLGFNVKDNYRLGISADDFQKLSSVFSLAKGAIEDEKKREIARNRGVFISDGLEEGKISFVFPGQGSQYADMLEDLSKKYQVVADTFAEADEILADMLDKSLSDYIFTNGRDYQEINDGLRQTEITQPAMLTADIALHRLFLAYGIKPDMVAGHSLGEYSALVAADVLSFQDALKAVAIRGKAMSEVDAEDKGTMASITGTIEEVEAVLEEVEGYAIAANKNSLSTTVISGSTPGIEEAIEKFKEKDMNAIPLSVSAAFHTKIVEPAAEPLSEFLDSIEFKTPAIPITSNVTGEFFPDDPEEIRDLMKQQVGASVEWTKQIQSMFDAGSTSFFEVGPKRALSSFVSDILSEENILPVVCNHPKKGGIRTFNDAIAALAALGAPLEIPSADSEVYHSHYRRSVVKPKRKARAKTGPKEPSSQPSQQPSQMNLPSSESMRYDQYQNFLNQMMDYTRSDAAKSASLGYNFDDIVITGTGVGLPGKHKEVFAPDNVERILRGDNLIESLPREKLEKQLEKNIRRLIKKSSGEAEFYSPSSYDDVIRLAGQQGKFDLVEEFGVKPEFASTYDLATALAIASGLEALKDAGIPLVREYKKTSTGSYLPGDFVLPKELQDRTGIIFASAFPGFDSFAEEISSFKEHKIRDENRQRLTELYGEISRRVSGDAKDYLLNKIDRELQELDKEVKDYTFNRKILLEVLSFGHAQFAQLIRAKGPNTQVNAACASTTQALGMAQDWIRTGRADRVIVISADNITSDNLFEWLGSGFLASGAASIKDKVEEAALPFDRRRGGMIVGMGAAGFMVEPKSEADRRGVVPIVELLGTHYSNSAYHGTRLDTRHVSEELQQFMRKIERSHNLTTDEIGRSMMFMSHETYTPRRGGSAAAEIRSLRETFGNVASQINIANTKGFTGHPMGAGIEDAIAIKSVEKGQIPPIANFKEPDPDLGNLKLSSGGKNQVDYALRLAAGFGSQISFALYKRIGSGNRFGSGYDAWIESIGGKRSDLYHEGKTLRLKDTGAPGKLSSIKSQRKVSTPAQRQVSSTPVRRHVSTTSAANKSEIIDKIQKVMADMTGYPQDMLDPSLDIEADLGIDTVKMAESIGQLNETFGVEADQSMNIADYNTIGKVADYYVGRIGSEGGSVAQTSSPSTSQAPVSGSSADKSEIVSKIQNVMADMTGYPKDMLDPSLDIEADLGIDTVKMAESMGQLNDTFGVQADQSLNIADYNTIDKMANYYATKISGGGQSSTPSQSSPAKSVSKPAKSVKALPGVFDKIVKIITEITGYPSVMIPDGSINLSQDLGVDDAIKSEIDTKVASEFGISSDLLRSSKTVGEMVDVVSDGSPPQLSQPTKKVKQEKKPKETPKSLTSGKANVSNEIRDQVYEIISEQTGYPTMMVEDSLNLKDDLGIDNLTKQTIISDIGEKFGGEVDELMKSLSVGDILHAVAGEELPELENAETEDVHDASSIPRFTGPVSSEETLDAVIDIIADKTGYPPEMLDPTLDLESELGIDTVKQAEIFGIAREKFGVAPIDGMQLSEYNTINKIADLLSSSTGSANQIIEQTTSESSESTDGDEPSTFRYVLRMNPSEVEPEFDGELIVITSEDIEEMSEADTISVVENIADLELSNEVSLLFLDVTEDNIGTTSELFTLLKEHVDQLENLIIASKPDVDEENSIHHVSPLQGAIGGMFKALAMEFDHISGKIVIYEELEQLNNELGTPGVEIVYQEGKRFEVALSAEDLRVEEFKLPEDAVLLASGGAQGITYELIKSICSENNTLILLGRTEIRDDAEFISSLSVDELEKEKFKLMEKLKEEGEQVTPVMLEKQWAKRTKSANVYSSLSELREMGCEVHYYSVDVTNTESIEEMFEKAYLKLDDKNITHFIHGAGIEISRATTSKSEDEFKLVYDVKTAGFENILAGLRLDKLDIIVGFSSVAGRFGNATQVDYSAANEYLTKRCAELDREGIRSIVIDWSAWAEIGMAIRGSTMKVLESQGVTPIPVEEGIQRFQSELALGEELEVVISGKLGALASRVNWYEPDFFRGIMMDEFSGIELRSSRVLSLEKDRYLDDHRIDGKAVLPGVMGLETMSEVSRAIQDESASVIYDVTFTSPVKLPRDDDLEIITFAKRSSDKLLLDLKSKFIGPDGTQLGDLRQHFNATVVTGTRVPGFPVLMKKQVEELTENSVLNQDQIYDTFFHGPSYQVVSELNALYDDAVIARYNQPEKTMFEGETNLEINPLMIEAAFQTAGLHMLYVKKQMALPAVVGAIHIFNTEEKPHLLRAYFMNETETHATYNVEIIDKNGVCIGLLLDYSMIKTGDVDTEDLPLEDQDDLITIRKEIGKLDPELVVINTDCLEEVTEDFIQGFLLHQELTRFSGLQAKKKRSEWLGGRIAAKIALARSYRVGLTEIEIEKDENRSPYTMIYGNKTDVSITHSHGIAIAVAGETTVDLEKIEERHPSFLKEAFSAEEMEKFDLLNLDDTTVTKYWTMKEAHLKRMRIGLKTNLHGVKIEENGRDTSIVNSPQGSSFCQSRITDNFVVTIAKPEDEAKITSLF